MNFNQIISDIKQLVGLELQAVNPSTASITLVSIDLDKNRYIVQPSDTKKQITITSDSPNHEIIKCIRGIARSLKRLRAGSK